MKPRPASDIVTCADERGGEDELQTAVTVLVLGYCWSMLSRRTRLLADGRGLTVMVDIESRGAMMECIWMSRGRI